MPINRIAVYHLETLVWIDQLGTFAAAAERLNTTQPAITARVREMEAQLGAPLFQREGRSMALTAAGRQLVRRCKDILGDLQGAFADFCGMIDASGIVRIGAGEIVAASCLPDFVATLKQSMPLVGLELDIDLTATLIHKIVTGRTDLAFIAGASSHPTLVSSPIGEVPLVWLASREVARDIDHKQSTLKTPLWSLTNHSPIFGRLQNAMERSGLSSRPIEFCNNARLMIDIVKAGGGFGIFPETMVQREMREGSLVPLREMPPVSPIEFNVVMRATDKDPLILEIFDRASRLNIENILQLSKAD